MVWRVVFIKDLEKMVNDITEFYKVINSTDYINIYNNIRTKHVLHMEYTQCNNLIFVCLCIINYVK